MAEQDDGTQGTIPPKVAPLANAEPTAPAAPAAAPGAPRPITVRLKPVTPVAASTPPPAVDAHIPSNPKATARVPVPEAVAPVAVQPVTVRLRPAVPATGAAAPTATAPVAPIAPLPKAPPAPGSNPLPDGPKPPSVAQVQAAKSKTSRISLDSAIGVAPTGEEKDGPKTIRLKRPSDLTSPAAPSAPASTATAHKTSRIPDSTLPEGGDDSAGVTQKKTLKIKRPGAKPEASAEAAGDGFPDGVQLTPLGAVDFSEKGESSVFTTVAVALASVAAVVLLLLTFYLGAHAVGPDAGKNALASVKGPELPWPAKISN
jgi:hypothetical protein